MSSVFKKLFGIPEADIKKTCILLPSNDRDLFNPLNPYSLEKGLFFDVTTAKEVSLVSLKNRSLAGDCVMHLKQTSCRRVILFGGCGGIELDIGSKAVVKEALNLESFSLFLGGDGLKDIQKIIPPGDLTERFLKFAKGKIESARCATVSSLYLEDEKRDKLKGLGIDCVDMESSMVFSASAACSMEAASLFYCTDTPGDINYYDSFPLKVREQIKGGRKSLARLLIKFLKSE